MNTLVITRLTIQEARRRKLLWTALLLGLAFLAFFGIGLYFMYRDAVQHITAQSMQLNILLNFALMAGLYTVNFLVVMMAVLTPVDTLSGEITSHTIQCIVTKPLNRWEVVVGKWLGFVVMLLLYVAFMAGGVMLIVYAITRYNAPNAWEGIGLMLLAGLVLLTVSILGGTRLSTLANGVLGFGLYGLAFIGGWIEQIGALVRNETAVNLGIMTSLVMPSEALWKRAAYQMQPPVIRELGVTPFSAASAPSDAMIVYAGLYVLAILGLALWAFQRRDL